MSHIKTNKFQLLPKLKPFKEKEQKTKTICIYWCCTENEAEDYTRLSERPRKINFSDASNETQLKAIKKQ